MKKQLRRSLAAKVTALLLAVVLLLTAMLLAIAGVTALYMAGTAGTAEAARARTAEAVMYRYAWQLARDVLWEVPLDSYEDMAFTFTAEDDSGALVSGTYEGGAYLAKTTYTYWYQYYPYADSNVSIDKQLTVTLYADPEPAGGGWLPLAVRVITGWYTHRWLLLMLGALCFFLFVGLVIFLHAAAGWQPEGDTPVCNAIDRIPFDVYTGLYVLLAAIELMLLARIEDWLSGGWYLLSVALFGVLDLFLALGYTMSIATRLKTGTLWRNTVVGRVLRFIGRGLAAMGRHLPLVGKTLLLLAALSVAELLIIGMNFHNGYALLGWWLAGQLILIPLVLLLVLGLRRLQRGVQEIAAGRVEHQIDTRYLPGELCRTAEQLNHIGDGLSEAVEARLKSERFKTELITNVSHDIKTPLTSIINYVDLMEKQQPEDPVLREYLEVLQRQSARLKKLIEDLIEASKASTGNLTVERAPCQLGVLLEQTVGEYAEKAELGQLTLLLQQPEQPVTVLADGRHLWRVFDNLLNNICKYAQPGTRVYLDLAVRRGMAHITFRNISRVPLHISGEELMERFVRGDSSRHTEGSGLGLSIARSLIELQGGTLALTVDGDLFKVELTMPTLPDAPTRS